jgi:hypothetical protein
MEAHTRPMLAIAYIITRDEMRRHLAGARADDPVIPERMPRRRRRLSAGSAPR